MRRFVEYAHLDEWCDGGCSGLVVVRVVVVGLVVVVGGGEWWVVVDVVVVGMVMGGGCSGTGSCGRLMGWWRRGVTVVVGWYL